MRPVDLFGLHLEASTNAPVVLLREHDEPHRVIPIFIGAPEATAIALAAAGEDPPRPLTHDLTAALVNGLGGRLRTVEVTELRNGTFHARILLEGATGPLEVDSRPSDAIALALRLHAPLFVADDVMDAAGTIVREPDDDEAIEEALDEFRSFLDDVQPADFEGTDVTGGTEADDATGDTGEADAGPADEGDGDPGDLRP